MTPAAWRKARPWRPGCRAPVWIMGQRKHKCSISGVCDLRILFVGDVVGRSGRTAVLEYLPGMIRDWALDLVIVNGENSAGGFGITEAIYQEFIDAAADPGPLANQASTQP